MLINWNVSRERSLRWFVPVLWRWAGRLGTLQPGEEEVKGQLHEQPLHSQRRALEEALFRCAHQKDKRQPQVAMENGSWVQSLMKLSLQCWSRGWGKLWKLYSWRHLNLVWAKLWASPTIKLALLLAAGCTTVTSRGLFQPIVFYFMESVKLRFVSLKSHSSNVST